MQHVSLRMWQEKKAFKKNKTTFYSLGQASCCQFGGKGNMFFSAEVQRKRYEGKAFNVLFNSVS